MLIHRESIGHYLAWIKAGQHFAFVGYSDAEWRCILGGEWAGTQTALGQTIDVAHGELLLDVLRRRQHHKWFLFAAPSCLWQMPGFAEGQIDWVLGRHNITIEGYERDMVTDDLARNAELYPLVAELCGMKVILVGNTSLAQLPRRFKRMRHWVHVGIESPNLHMVSGGIDDAVSRVRELIEPGCMVLLSAGVSAAIIADRIWDGRFWAFDCGSMWDAFAGVGAQREWRSKLYQDVGRWKKWQEWNLSGKPRGAVWE